MSASAIKKIDPRLLEVLTPEELEELDLLLDSIVWIPQEGPQTIAYESRADVIGYGGAAGGGKSDLGIGMALTKAKRTLIIRDEATQLTGIYDRIAELFGSRNGYNSRENAWRLGDGRKIDFGSIPNPGDETKHQGRPHDLIVFDEAANLRERQVRFLMGWNRSVDLDVHCQTLMTFNPPTTNDGRWIIDYFSPWIDKRYAGQKALPGELRWFGTMSGKDIEVQDSRKFVVVGGKALYDFDPDDFKQIDIVTPKSRTFIPSRITDNKYLIGTGYMATLQALPEPLRSQMLTGDFEAGIGDDPWQVIPTAWVDAAMARWKRPDKLPPMDSVGVDVARGGKDKTVISARHGMWFDELRRFAGSETPDGPSVAGQVISCLRDRAPIHIDVIGVGASPYDFIKQTGAQVYGVDVRLATDNTDTSGRLRFFNLRSELYWRAREALDPARNTGICLPPDQGLRADLTAVKWSAEGKSIKVESREKIVDRLGRSPDDASALILALIDTPKIDMLIDAGMDSYAKEYNPFDNM